MTPKTRKETYLAKAAGDDVSIPSPITREEVYLNALATGEAEGLPDPVTREEVFLKAAAEGGGSSVTVEPLSVTENGAYTADEGKAYSPVTVNVPQTEIEALSVTANGTYEAEEGHAYSPVTVNVGSSQSYKSHTGIGSNPWNGLSTNEMQEWVTALQKIESRDAFGLLLCFYNLSDHTGMPLMITVQTDASNNLLYVSASALRLSTGFNYQWSNTTKIIYRINLADYSVTMLQNKELHVRETDSYVAVESSGMISVYGCEIRVYDYTNPYNL